MTYFAGVDVWLEESSIRMVDAVGEIIGEGQAPSEPARLVKFFGNVGCVVSRIGL